MDIKQSGPARSSIADHVRGTGKAARPKHISKNCSSPLSWSNDCRTASQSRGLSGACPGNAWKGSAVSAPQ